MTDEYGRKLRYKPNPDANLVLQADRRELPRRDLEPTGEPETLYGKIDPSEFGSLANRDKPASTKKTIVETSKINKLKKNQKYASVLQATNDLEGLSYTPKTMESQQTYELILAFVERLIGDQTQEIFRSAADEVLKILKDEDLKDLDKKTGIEQILNSKMQMNQFSDLVALSKKIDDYELDPSLEDKDAVDEEMGVAVVFDEGLEKEEDGLSEKSAEETDEEKNFESRDYEVSEEKTKIAKKLVKSELDINKIDAFYLQRLLNNIFDDQYEVQEKSKIVMDILENTHSIRESENKLVELFEYGNFDTVNLLIANKDKILWGMKLSSSAEDIQKRNDIEKQMQELGFGNLLEQIKGNAPILDTQNLINDSGKKNYNQSEDVPAIKSIDLESLAFTQGNHLMTNKNCRLPDGSTRKHRNEYDEVHIPIPTPKPFSNEEKLVPISNIPAHFQESFSNTNSLNRIQSKVYPIAFNKDENILLCAPTGAGKTNVALLCILREVNKYYNTDTNSVMLNKFKIVYIAPMKALVQEMVSNFQQKLSHLNIKVSELTGDRQLTKQQITETQVIVTTPEKWDVVTRKQSDTSYTNMVGLIIIDEIHLLHDDRGPVIEAIICRTKRLNYESSRAPTRLVGLSATLPNYIDVATFLEVDHKTGLFFFDNSYRPCPLKQEFIGVSEKKAIKRLQLMNNICYEKTLNHAGRNQVLIFVHSRKETYRTAKHIIDTSIEKETIGLFLNQASSKAILEEEIKTIKDNNLKEILTFGFGIHHAGLSRSDRASVEELFAEGHIQILVSTATLAWGVNLPAHTVIIKGTQVYSPEKGRWSELSSQDVLQMLGRAGRPQFDSFGEGIIITTHVELQYYLSLLNHQLPIESQLIAKLPDTLNAEIVLGNINSRDEGVEWLRNTYLYIRMMKNGYLYGITQDEHETDKELSSRLIALMHSACLMLDSHQLIKYDRISGKIQSTEIGRIASHYYISSKSMNTYNQQLKPYMSMIELFRTFSSSEEFKLIPVREEEKLELSKLIEKVPIPVKESIESNTSKINVLLQSYISQLKLEGFALIADMVYVTQSAVRILRAMFEISLKRGWASLTHELLDFCKIVEKRSWLSMSPLRQFSSIPTDLIKKIERKDFPWERFYDLNPEEIGELIGIPKAGKLIYKYVHHFPKIELQAMVQPITRTLLKMDLTISPDFEWDDKVHGSVGEVFRVFVEDVNEEVILHQDTFILKKKYKAEEHFMSFTVPLFKPLPPCYFITIVSDRWLHSKTRLPVSFKHLILPEKHSNYTELYDMQPLPTNKAFDDETLNSIYNEFEYFNPVQTQVFSAMFKTDENIMIGAPVGSGKTVCAELSILRLWNQKNFSKCLYLAPKQEIVDYMYIKWHERFSILGKNINKCTGELSTDLSLLNQSDIIMATPDQWDVISRRWKNRNNVQLIGLVIADEIHLISGENGPTYEIVLSRMRYISSQIENQTRFVSLSVPLANHKDLAHWLGASDSSIFNFSPTDRSVPLEMYFQTYNIQHHSSALLAMQKPAMLFIKQNSNKEPVIVFVSSRKECRAIAVDFVKISLKDTSSSYVIQDLQNVHYITAKIEDNILKQCILQGVGYFHEALSLIDKSCVQELYTNGYIKILFVCQESCYSVSNLFCYITIIMGTTYFEGKEHRYVDYPVSDVLKMIGRAGRQLEDHTGLCLLMTQSSKKEYYKNFIYEGLPLESHLDQYLHDHFNAEIVTKTIENKQDAIDYLTWTFMYRRMAKNPNYYNLQGTSHRHLSDHLSELVETIIKHLEESKCISVENEIDVTPLNLGMICAYYNIHYSTIELFSQSLTSRTKLRGLLEIISSATEFESLPIRRHEDEVLKNIFESLPMSYINNENIDFNMPNIKTNVLLHAHFSRIKLPQDLQLDQTFILSKIIPLLQACVDVISSKGWFNPAITTMELCQMCIQAQWERESTLKQIPHFDSNRIKLAETLEVKLVSDIKEIEDEVRERLLDGLASYQIKDIANFVNKFPVIDFEYCLLTPKEECKTNCLLLLNVELKREIDDDDDNESKDVDISVRAPFYPKAKLEGWWIIIGDIKTNSILGIKRLTFEAETKIELEFQAPSEAGKHEVKIFLVADCYLGCDQEYDLDLDVEQGSESSSSDEENEET